MHEPVRVHADMLSPIHGQVHHNLQLQRVWDGGMVGCLPHRTAASSQVNRAPSGRVLSRPCLNALAPPTNQRPESSRNHPWSPAKSNGAKSVDMREINIGCQI